TTNYTLSLHDALPISLNGCQAGHKTGNAWWSLWRRPRVDLRRRQSLSGPALSHGSQELLLVLLDLPDKGLVFGILVRGGPEHHFREDGCKIESFSGEQVKEFSPVGGV